MHVLALGGSLLLCTTGIFGADEGPDSEEGVGAGDLACAIFSPNNTDWFAAKTSMRARRAEVA